MGKWPTSDANADSSQYLLDPKYDEFGNEFSWSELTQNLFKIKSTPNNSDIAISTNYRDTWFYIDDSDLDSKTTFSLLMQLFSLQSGKSEGVAPLLTLPIGQWIKDGYTNTFLRNS